MADAATLQTRLDALRAMRADGIRAASFGEDRVEFRSDAELAAAIADLERQLTSLSGRSVITVGYVSSDRGWS